MTENLRVGGHTVLASGESAIQQLLYFAATDVSAPPVCAGIDPTCEARCAPHAPNPMGR
jgi:hypothetical protein